jgi:5'-nucleotidase
MANPGDLLVPRDLATQSYPVYATASDGVSVPIVTTGGSYKYLGRLVVEFDAAGRVEQIDPGSGPIRVADDTLPDGVRADAILLNAVAEPVQAFLDSLAISEIALSEVRLDGREQTIRTRETNLGNLMADAVLWQARAAAGEFGAPEADVAIVNAGAFRLNVLKDAGPLTRLDAFEIAPFASFVSVVEDVSPAELKLLVENALSSLSPDDGRFGQIAGFRVTYDASGEALRFDAANHPLNTGARVLSIQLDDGTYVVQDGAVVPGAPAVAVATIDFLARGGDRYPVAGAVTNLGVSYQQALESYLVEALGGVISAGEYPEGGEGRIVAQ